MTRSHLLTSCLLVLISHAGFAQHQREMPVGTFRLRFSAPRQPTAPDCFFDRLTVIRRSTGATVQTITFSDDMVHALPCGIDAGVMAKIVDANNDSHRDMLLLSFAAATNQLYDVWLYRPAHNRFERVLEGLSNPSVNTTRREITSLHQNGASDYEKQLYRYRNGTYYRYEVTTRTFDQSIRKNRIVVKRLVNGRMQVVRRYTEAR